MRFLQIFIFLVSLPSLGDAATTDTSTFVTLLDTLGKLGYHRKGATTASALHDLASVEAHGTGSPCARTVRCHRCRDRSLISSYLLMVSAKV